MKKQIQAGLASLRGNKASRAVLVAGTALSIGTAHAATGDVDVSAVVTAIVAAGAAIATVGIAYLSMQVGAKVFKWVKAAF